MFTIMNDDSTEYGTQVHLAIMLNVCPSLISLNSGILPGKQRILYHDILPYIYSTTCERADQYSNLSWYDEDNFFSSCMIILKW